MFRIQIQPSSKAKLRKTNWKCIRKICSTYFKHLLSFRTRQVWHVGYWPLTHNPALTVDPVSDLAKTSSKKIRPHLDPASDPQHCGKETEFEKVIRHIPTEEILLESSISSEIWGARRMKGSMLSSWFCDKSGTEQAKFPCSFWQFSIVGTYTSVNVLQLQYSLPVGIPFPLRNAVKKDRKMRTVETIFSFMERTYQGPAPPRTYIKYVSAGNRTRVACVTGEHST